MATTLRNGKKGSTINIDSSIVFPSLGSRLKPKSQCPKFILIKNKDQNHPIRSFNIFLLSKALEGISYDAPEKITFTREGDLLILTKNETQANKFLRAKSLADICKIDTMLHPTLNTVKGVVFAPALRFLSEKEIIEGLKDQDVVDCKKITKFINGDIVPTSLHILSFNRYELPSEIKIGFLNAKIDPYIQAPLQCKKCFLFGHTKKYCKKEIVTCEVCSLNIHDPTPCSKLECVNCKSSHRANNKNCPVYKKNRK